jgi:hypothetical protein
MKGRSRERDWKGGGGRAVCGPVRRRWSEAHGTVAPAKGGGGSGVTEEGEIPGWAGLGWTGPR